MIRDVPRVPFGYVAVARWAHPVVIAAFNGRPEDLGVVCSPADPVPADTPAPTPSPNLSAPPGLDEVLGALAHFTMRSNADPEVVRLLRALATTPGMLHTGLGVVRMGGVLAFAEWVQTLGYWLGI